MTEKLLLKFQRRIRLLGVTPMNILKLPRVPYADAVVILLKLAACKIFIKWQTHSKKPP